MENVAYVACQLPTTVSQIKFSHVGQQGATSQYWRDIATIAAFVAARLQYSRPRCNDLYDKYPTPRMSTIRVDAHKEKWGEVRVYCTLADTDEVAAKWREEKNSGEVTAEFKTTCRVTDAKIYRRAYLDMVELVPHYRDAIVTSADHFEVLYADVNELDRALCTLSATSSFLLNKWEVADVEQLRALLHGVYTRTRTEESLGYSET